jgi:CRISPR-associated protein Csm4
MHFLIKLKFKTGLSVNSANVWENSASKGTIHSDTLFGAIMNQWVKIPAYYDIKTLVSILNTDSPPFLISSAFPFFDEYYYLPVPIGNDKAYMEMAKDIRYLEIYDFAKLAKGDKTPLQKMPQKDPQEFIHNFTRPRVTIDRISSTSNIYDFSGWSIDKGGGLYFILKLNDNNLKETINLCINLLGEAGIGADRNVGFGSFAPEIIPIGKDSIWSDLLDSKNKKSLKYYTLSLTCPYDLDEAKKGVSYKIISRTGWIYSNTSMMQAKRKKTKMFSEGSIFDEPIKGHVADVTPKQFKQNAHNVYRYGLGMMIEGNW